MESEEKEEFPAEVVERVQTTRPLGLQKSDSDDERAFPH